MEAITSRKNKTVSYMRRLGSDRAFRRQSGEYLTGGMKLLEEALICGAEVTAVLWEENSPRVLLPDSVRQYTAPPGIIEYISPLKTERGPLFTASIAGGEAEYSGGAVIILENVQDPGNVGTVIRTANAFGVELVALTGECADPYNPKTVRAAMGALFRQRVIEKSGDELAAFLKGEGVSLYGAAASDNALDVRSLPRGRTAVAIGNEGSGLTREFLSECACVVKIPMRPGSESLNAAVAAAIVIWELMR